jgi:proline iminopeptidase
MVLPMIHRAGILLTSLLLAAACAAEESREEPASVDAAAREGHVSVRGGRIWYRMEGGGTGTPIILLHGGPGFPSAYLRSLLALSDDRPVYIYDQLGTGLSDHPSDTSLWHIERFVEELQAFRDSLGLSEVYLYGHSWGTMLAGRYMEGKPSGVQGVIFASPCLSAARWMQDADSLVRLLPDANQRAIAAANSSGDYQSLAYQAAMAAYAERYINRTPFDSQTIRANERMNMEVYLQMWGPSEFRATGNLKAYDATPRLGEITVPTLFTAGEFDEATPATTRYYASLVPGSEFRVVPGAGHMTTIDNPAETVRQVREWMRKVDARAADAPRVAP